MPPDPAGGASAYVRDTGCCVFPTPVNNPTKSLKAATAAIPRTIPSSNNSSLLSNKFNNNGPNDQDDAGISPPPPYTTIYPPSPPSSAPSSPSSGPVLSGAQNDNSVLPLSPPVSISNGVKAPSVLSTVFPESSAVHSMSSRPVDLSALVPSWKGALLEDTTESNKKTLYVVGGHFDEVNLRDAVCGVLERAEDELQADAVVIVLEKNQAELSDLLHSLMYVGGTIVTQPALEPNPAFLLVGLDV